MITLKEEKLYISKDDAVYVEGTFVDLARSIKRYITSEQIKGGFAGWDVEHYAVPEIDRTTKEIRTDSFALVFTKNGNNMFYIETLLKPDYFTTNITCPILKIMNEPVAHCNGNADELFYNGGFNSHVGFGSMLSNYIRPTILDVDSKLDSGVYESRRHIKNKTELFKRNIMKESTSKKIPYDLVSSFVILRDYADVDDDYINEDHRMLVDVADSIYNVGISVSDMSKKYQDIYKKYGKSYFDKVLRDIRALDTQATSDNINDLIDEVNDKLSRFN